ncbi:carbon monoxide dehydrogenase [Roseibium algicola]|jgi:carbon-monoxide dehydrogenase medium subunit|uniref:Carbon monoxide dehydrogenase n=1 Tax=Roseibium algicola TaxID=2857014 RepID=A0ABN4WYS5_9HYPH|nr:MULTISPECIES: xanthine dehydrogenase family protein subunit M [Stappiaceae]MCR9282997.1 xanthine dehydrogenase family protein subunit M [Paracoccaceae bacterium]MEE2865365.1 xanthine dehydrogenase family protein subunit M [Pseudomonadota bacterium]AMN53394.1 carbon monoxide dehydrogenase [Labrenzia sp. CP4]AQQ06614.1 carbon monoxide dehydrogenase [Roseibium aggregatum]ERP97955.1 carbon-monoxide dehydrogenase [Labrenzia sp. C1B10]
MYETTYHKAGSVAEAASLMANADDGKFLGGGQTLLPTMKQRLAAPSDLVDVTKIADMKGISANGDGVTIGAATSHFEVSTSDLVKQKLPGLASLAGGIGDPAVRHMGTIGGSIANNDPAADYPAALVALGATVVTSKRELAAEEFFTGMFETALDEDEIVVAVKFPGAAASAYAKYPNPASRYAMAGVFVAKGNDGSVKVAVTGAGQGGVFRMSAMETALASNFSADAVAGIAPDADDLLSDIHGSAAYRANLVTVMAKRAVQKA